MYNNLQEGLAQQNPNTKGKMWNDKDKEKEISFLQ